MKKVLKFKFKENEGFLSVVENENFYYALVQKDTQKIMEIKNTHQLHIAYELKNPVFINTFVNVIEDQEVIRWVFEQLKADNNLYFKNLDDSLCVIEIAIDKG